MDRRIFPIDEKCFIIFTGQSSGDNLSFLRIGNSSKLTEEIQKHTRYIVVNDAKKVNINLEKENIKYMGKGKIKYLCTKKNRDELFRGLKEKGVDVNNLYTKELSNDIENIGRIENKKHFFTIFYNNQNIKLVSNNEIFFDLFESYKKKWNYDKERTRLLNFIKKIDTIHNDFKKKSILKIEVDIGDKPDFVDISLFIVQDDKYTPLSIGMFSLEKNKDSNINLIINSSQRFNVGKEANLVIIDKGMKKNSLTGFFIEGEVVESQILYNFCFKIKFDNPELESLVYKYYEFLLNRIKK